MARSRTGRAAHIVRQKRLSTWFNYAPVTTAMTAAGGTIFYSLNAAALALRPFTIVRTRFLVSIKSDQQAATENQIGAFGMAVVSDQAVAVGVTAVPTPITDQGSDLFFAWQPLIASFVFSTGVGTDSQNATTFVMDSKAMRKVDVGQDIVGVGEGEFAIGDGISVTTMGLQLIKVN